MTGPQTRVRAIAALSLLGGFLGILTGFIFTYPIWLMSDVEAELEGWDRSPYWTGGVLVYTALNLVVGAVLYGIVFALLTVRSGSPWSVKTRRVVVLCTFLLVALLVGLPNLWLVFSPPHTLPRDGRLSYLIDAVLVLAVVSLPVLVIVEPVAVLGEWVLRVALRISTPTSVADSLDNDGD